MLRNHRGWINIAICPRSRRAIDRRSAPRTNARDVARQAVSANCAHRPSARPRRVPTLRAVTNNGPSSIYSNCRASLVHFDTHSTWHVIRRTACGVFRSRHADAAMLLSNDWPTGVNFR
jgi:hypothetical protein